MIRHYQIDCVSKIRDGWKQFRKQLVVLPTGSGKTVIASILSKLEADEGKKILFLAHREELLQ